MTSSSEENAGTPATSAVDGNDGTRWSSAFSDPQWIRVDLSASWIRRSVRTTQAPVKPGVKLHDLLVVSLGGQGQYEHVINSTGSPTSGTSTVPSTVVSFP